MRDNVSERDKWRAFALAMGLVWSWFALYMMIQNVYEGLQQTIRASVHGGTYPIYFMQGWAFVYWMVIMLVTSFLLTYGARARP